MRPKLRHSLLFGAMGLAGAALGCSAAVGDDGTDETVDALTTNVSFPDAFGTVKVISTDTVKGIDLNNPFFKNLGVNGRTCNSCHKLENALGISVPTIQAIFTKTNGLDPIFRINDGSNAPKGPFADTSSVDARRRSFSMLLNHGVIRVGIGVPAAADFKLLLALDPYFFASSAELSLFRRPLPSVNVAFNTLTMWDGRESEGRPAVRDALLNQANDATQGHAQRPTPLDNTTRAAIADFQLKLFSAQGTSNLVGSFTRKGCDVSQSEEEPGACEPAHGGPTALSKVLTEGVGEDGEDFPKFTPGINNPFPFGADGKPAATHNNISFVIFEAWESETLGPRPTVNGVLQDATLTKNRGELGDGENIFYTKPMVLKGVPGLNDVSGGAPTIQGTCTTCHNTPDVGNHSRARFMNTGTSSPFLADNPLAVNLVDFPNYVLARNSDGKFVVTTDPGLALRTGKFRDIGKFKIPNLRGLGSREPFFHNGEARSLTDVVKFYNTRFHMNLTSEEIRKMVVFLRQT